MNIFQQFILSLISPKDIARFRFQGIGKTILYVFFLSFLSIIPAVYYSSSYLINGVDTIQSSFEKDLPPFKIENGILQSEKDAPIIINKKPFTLIFDSTGTANEREITKSENTIALLKEKAYIVTGGKVQTLSYSMVNDLTITNDDIQNLLKTIDSSLAIIIPILAIIIYILNVGIEFIEISLLAWVSLLFKKLLNRNIQYRHTWRITAYSITLPTVFFIIMDSLQIVVPNGFIVYWFVAIIMIYLAIKEIPMPKKKETRK